MPSLLVSFNQLFKVVHVLYIFYWNIASIAVRVDWQSVKSISKVNSLLYLFIYYWFTLARDSVQLASFSFWKCKLISWQFPQFWIFYKYCVTRLAVSMTSAHLVRPTLRILNKMSMRIAHILWLSSFVLIAISICSAQLRLRQLSLNRAWMIRHQPLTLSDIYISFFNK